MNILPIWRKDISLHVGNDIVDLHAAETADKTGDIRFVRRVLTGAERRCFGRAESPDIYLWAVWAAKETAYKALVKANPDVASWPRHYDVVFEDDIFRAPCPAMVKTPLDPVRVLLFVNREYIHCIGGTPGVVCPDTIIRGVEKIDSGISFFTGSDPELESAAVRRAAVRSISEFMNLSAADIGIRRHRSIKGLGPPMVYIRTNAAEIDISLSHHGRFAAFAFQSAMES
ncbi:MAG: 4'-phosphopantetheinyl transferase superfamily protein [Desulfobacteraceae bacterium]|nr:4'-phosphopantetheinyl transferase superfamily protein [Desulfobacteraceae bacterium]